MLFDAREGGTRARVSYLGRRHVPYRREILTNPKRSPLPACSSRPNLSRASASRAYTAATTTTPRGQRVACNWPALATSRLLLPALTHYHFRRPTSSSLPHAVFRREHARAGRLAGRRRRRCATLASRQPWRTARTRLDLARPSPHTGNCRAAACEQAPNAHVARPSRPPPHATLGPRAASSPLCESPRRLRSIVCPVGAGGLRERLHGTGVVPRRRVRVPAGLDLLRLLHPCADTRRPCPATTRPDPGLTRPHRRRVQGRALPTAPAPACASTARANAATASAAATARRGAARTAARAAARASRTAAWARAAATPATTAPIAACASVRTTARGTATARCPRASRSRCAR